MGSSKDYKDLKVPVSEIRKVVEESRSKVNLFQNMEDENCMNFSSVIKEIKDEDSSYLVKIRPPVFLISGLLSNFSRIISGLKNTKILDNKRWKEREVESLKKIYPEMVADHKPFENAVLMEKINGEPAAEVLRSDISDEEKEDIILDMARVLRKLHDMDVFHGEPNTNNCIIGEDEKIYWIDFEVVYDEDLHEKEKKAKDLEQFILSVLGSFDEEGEIGIDDREIIERIFREYGDDEIQSIVRHYHSLPLIGPYRIYQFSFNSLGRFYRAQINFMEYLGLREERELAGIFGFSS